MMWLKRLFETKKQRREWELHCAIIAQEAYDLLGKDFVIKDYPQMGINEQIIAEAYNLTDFNEL